MTAAEFLGSRLSGPAHRSVTTSSCLFLRKEQEMPSKQGNLALLDDPVAQELLHSTNLARLVYTWRDGTPRAIPIWFHWDGETIVLGTPPAAPKTRALPGNPKVALTIDRDGWPYRALLIRGTARVET